MNQVQIFGRLTRDPELKYTQAGKPVSNFSMAVNRFSDNEADFFECVAWEKQAENINSSCKKGHRLLIWGRLQQERWTDQQTQQQRSTIKIVVSGFSFIEPPPQQGAQPPGGAPGYQQPPGYQQQPPGYQQQPGYPQQPGFGQPPGYVPPAGPGPQGYPPQGQQQPGAFLGRLGQGQSGPVQQGPGQQGPGQPPGGPQAGQGGYPPQGQQQPGYSGSFDGIPF